MGVLRLAKAYGDNRLTNACRRAGFFRSVSFRSIKSILEQKLDQRPWGEEIITSNIPQVVHENIRGQKYYSNKKEENKCI
jgi:hypothetical protein